MFDAIARKSRVTSSTAVEYGAGQMADGLTLKERLEAMKPRTWKLQNGESLQGWVSNGGHLKRGALDEYGPVSLKSIHWRFWKKSDNRYCYIDMEAVIIIHCPPSIPMEYLTIPTLRSFGLYLHW